MGVTNGVAVALLLAVLALRPLANGVSATALAGFWVIAVLLVIGPGVLVCRRAGLAPAGAVSLLGQGATLGLAIHGLGFLAGRATGLHWLGPVIPLTAALASAALPGGPARDGSPAREAKGSSLKWVVLLGIVLLALTRLSLRSLELVGLAQPVDIDQLFHAGNAAALLHRWPLESPRIAGLHLNYPMLAYALPVQASEILGTPVADALLGSAPAFWIVLLALQLASLGRAAWRDDWAGVFAAAIVLFNVDPSQLPALAAYGCRSHLATGLYGSSTTVCGLVLLTGLATSLPRWLATGRSGELLATALLAAAASVTKASVLPPVVAGLAWLALRALRQPGPTRARALTAALVATACMAPAVLVLSTGAGAYSGVFSFAPGALFRSSEFAAASGSWPIAALPGSGVLRFGLWLVGFLGLAGVGAVLWIAWNRAPSDPSRIWMGATALSGIAMALLLATPDGSQAFFAYDGQLLLALFAGAALRLAASTPARALATVLVVAVLAAPAAHVMGRVVPAAVAGDVGNARRPADPVARDYVNGLSWLRTHAAKDALVFATSTAMVLSAFGEVQLFYETGLYSPRWWRTGGAEPYPDREALRLWLVSRPIPDPGAIAVARAVKATQPRRLLVVDRLAVDSGQGRLLARPLPLQAAPLRGQPRLHLLFANRALHVYEMLDDRGPS